MADLVIKKPNFRKYSVFNDGSEDDLIKAQAVSKGWELKRVKIGVDGNRFLIFKPNKFVDIGSNDVSTFDRQAWIEGFVKPEIEKRLKASSYMMAYDIYTQMTPNQKQLWTTYRQDLRNLPTKITEATGPDDITWPQKPTTPNIPEAKF